MLKNYGWLFLLTLLTACTAQERVYDHPTYWIRNHDKDYLQSRALPPLKIPANLANAHVGTSDDQRDPITSSSTTLPPLVLTPPGFHEVK